MGHSAGAGANGLEQNGEEVVMEDGGGNGRKPPFLAKDSLSHIKVASNDMERLRDIHSGAVTNRNNINYNNNKLAKFHNTPAVMDSNENLPKHENIPALPTPVETNANVHVVKGELMSVNFA